jgi:hypothetical protein
LNAAVAERVDRLERDRDRLADLLVHQRFLDAREDARVTAVQVRDRLARFLDQRVAGVEQLEGERDDRVGEDIHRISWCGPRGGGSILRDL